MTQFDELRPVEVKTLNVEPAAQREPDQPAVRRLLDVCSEIVTLRVKKSQAIRSIGCRGIIALEAIARSAGVDEVLDVVRATCTLRVKVIDLQLAPHGRLGNAAVSTPTAEGGPCGCTRFR